MSLDFASHYHTNWTEQPPAFANAALTPPHSSQTQLYTPGSVKHPIWGPRKVPAHRQPWDSHTQLTHGALHTVLRPSESIWGPPLLEQLSPGAVAPQLTPPGLSAWNSLSVDAELDPHPSSPLQTHAAPKLSILRPKEIPPRDYSSYDELVAAMASVHSPLCIVQFKSNRLEVFSNSSPSSGSPSSSGSGSGYVVVDADRGRDLGLVVAENVSPEEAALVRWRQFQKQSEALQLATGESTASETDSAPSVSAVAPKPIIRSARPCEVQLLDAKQAAEAKAVGLCSQKVAERGLKMSIVDAEYQWDRRKLTFYYCANQRVDFRDLIRDLFRIYKTRIWMCAV